MKRQIHLRKSAFAFLFLVSLCASPALRAQTLLNLDPGTGNSSATALNDAGDVVGYSPIFGPGGFTEAGFLYTAAGGSNPLNVSNSAFVMPNGINNSGVITGLYTDGSGNQNGFYDQNGTVTELTGAGSNIIGGSVGSGINNSGIAVGTGSDSESNGYAFYYTPSTHAITTINSLTTPNANGTGTNASGIAINDSGLITGTTQGLNTPPVAFIYNTTTSTLVTGNLGSLGGGSTTPTAINSLGQVEGTSLLADGKTSDAFLYSGGATGTLADIGSLGGSQTEAFGINSAGVVVGSGYTAMDAALDAFIYSKTTGIETLDSIYAKLLVAGGDGSPAGFVSLDQANAINSSGQIVGSGDYWTGSAFDETAFLLSPTGDMTMTPEPGTWALLLGGCGLLEALRRSRRRALRRGTELS